MFQCFLAHNHTVRIGGDDKSIVSIKDANNEITFNAESIYKIIFVFAFGEHKQSSYPVLT